MSVKEVSRMSIKLENTDSEEEMSDENEIKQEIEKEESFYTGKDGATIWYSNPDQVKLAPRDSDPIRPGVKPYARKAKTEIECWNLFMTCEMIEDILKHTNNEIKSTIVNMNNRYLCKETTMDELMAMFGLIIIIAGLNNTKHTNLDDLWRADGMGVDIFRMTMSLNRFNFLQKCIRFDDEATRNERYKLDIFSSVRSMFENFTKNCQRAYKPSDRLTVDEKYTPFRRKSSLRQSSTSAAYGIIMYALVDAKVFYTVNLEIHAGNQTKGPFPISRDPYDVVNRLVAPVSKTKRNVTCDKKFTSIPLAQHLLSEHGLTITGELSKTKVEVPPPFTKYVRGRAQFGFHDDLTLVSYAPKKWKVVLMLSTLHHDRNMEIRGEKLIPEIVSYYNATKSGVEVVDKLCPTYDVRNYSKRWPLLILFNMINIAAINSAILFRENNKSKVRRSEFMKLLGLAMLKPYLIERKNRENLPRELRKRIYDQVGEKLTYPPTSQLKSYKKCKVCPYAKAKMTKHTCIECHKPICMEHIVMTCRNCTT